MGNELLKIHYISDTQAKEFSLLNKEEQHKVWEMRNHPEIRKWMINDAPIPLSKHMEFMAKQSEEKYNLNYLIYLDNEIIGVASLHHIDLQKKAAWLGIYKNPNCKKTSIGQKLIYTICYIAFLIKKLSILNLEVLPSNIKAINAYKKSGFIEENNEDEFNTKQAHYRLIKMALKSSEWKNE